MSGKQLLIIGFTWPEPSTTAAGNRMLQLLHFFKEQHYKISFSSTATKSEHSLDLSSLDIEEVSISINDESFDDFIKALNPNIVVFDRFITEEQFGWRVAEFAPSAIRILDTEDLHSLRQTREKAHKAAIDFSSDFWVHHDITKRELASIYRSDLVLIISSYELQLLKTVIGINNDILLHLPFMVSSLSDTDINNLKPFEERTDFICLGNGKHSPNIDAIRWLKQDIWPLVRKQLPRTNLNIYGAYLPANIHQMHNADEGFLVHGWAKDVKEVMEAAKINLAPLRFGAGLKGKLLDAMCYGTPSITTTIGAEGMYDGDAFSGAIENEAAKFAEAAIQLYQGKGWKKAKKQGIQLIARLFQKKEHYKALDTKIKEVVLDLETHRSQNIIGSMLMHQTMLSSKYMAKWIEEKQKQKN